MRSIRAPLTIFAVVLSLVLFSCTPAKLVLSGGEQHPHPLPRVTEPGPNVLIFGFDGTGYNQLEEAMKSGHAPNLAALLGKNLGGGSYDHAYSAPDAESIFPSITVAAWSAIFTGAPTAYNSIPGNEWFAREQMQFYAPVPVSVPETGDTLKMLSDNLVGRQLTSPTLYQQAGVSSGVSMNMIYRGADTFTVVAPSAFVTMVSDYMAGTTDQESGNRALYQHLDENSVAKLLDTFKTRGIPRLQTVYFPGIDLYTHVAPGDPLEQEVNYLEEVTDPLVGKVIAEYQSRGMLQNTYVLVIADHGHTPVLSDKEHALGVDPETGPAAVLKNAGYRMRPFVLNPSSGQQDYQAAFAYEDSIAYVYLADRSTCPNPSNKCDWTKPPRYKEDVMPAVRAFYQANKTGKGAPRLKGKLEMILARRPGLDDGVTREYRVYDGRRLVELEDYVKDHRDLDLLDIDRRMKWLSVGPHGDRAGDILLMARTGLKVPIAKRYYFAHLFHSVHGSGSEQDSHIPLILSHQGCSSRTLKKAMLGVTGEPPTQLKFTPLVLKLLGKNNRDEICRAESK
jgi:Type I phosphodiesterase / nucleotide pyrophosphatase